MAYPGSITNEVDPISRIEGHLGIAVNVSSGKVANAYAHGNMWRGFENFLLNRDINDAITFTQRICGVCPVPHGMTSTYAVDTVLGYSQGHITFDDSAADGWGVPPVAVLMRNLVLGMEFLMSSITHFYHLAAPSYVQGPAIPPWTPYFDNSYYHTALRSGGRAYPSITTAGNHGAGFSADVWSTVIRSYVVALRARRLTFEAGALFAGRMPMTSCFIGGGVTYDKGEIGTSAFQARCDTFKSLAKEVGEFIVQEYVPIALALGALYPNYDNLTNATTLNTAYHSWYLGTLDPSTPASGNTGYGAGLGRFLAWGAFPATGTVGTLALPGGLKGGTSDFTVQNKADVASKFLSGSTSVPNNLVEDISHSRYSVAPADVSAYGSATGYAAYPGNVSRTKPTRASGYSYMKAPRWNNQACEVGPMARMYVSGLFKNGVALAATASLGAAYTVYTKACPSGTVNGALGLDPRMVKADIAVALVQAGLATLSKQSDGSIIVGSGAGLPTAASATIAAYADADTVITGAIADWVVLLTAGYSTIDRIRARALESLVLVQAILGAYTPVGGSWNMSTGDHTGVWAGNGWLGQLRGKPTGSLTWNVKSIPAGTSQGWGATEAPRGALMHQTTITSGKIVKYQCIVPTTWNGSPQDHAGNPGAIEAAVVGVPFAGTDCAFGNVAGTGTVHSVGGVEVLRAAQSFDPCIACAVH